MDSSTAEILFQNMEELVFDEDLIITPAILCEKSDISLTAAKYVLEEFIRHVKTAKPHFEISVTYLLCGKLKTGEYSIQIIDSIELEKKRELFSSISNEIVYSVQNRNTIDLNMIALSEKSPSAKSTALKGSIVSEKCTERLMKSKLLPPPPPQKIFEKKKPASFFKPVVKSDNNGEKKSSQATTTNSTVTKTQSQKKTGGLAGFLSQTSPKLNGENKQLKKTHSSDEDIRETKRPKLESNDSELSKVDVKVESEPQVSDIMNGDTKHNILRNEDKSVEKTKDKMPNEKQSTNKANSRKKQDGKKRKRIIVESESEDDLFANDEDDEKIDVDLEEEKPAITQPKEVIPKNKRRKAIENIYTDEDGYVVTKTEYVLASASEDEEAEVKDKKPVLKNVEKEEKKSPPQKAAAKGKKAKKMDSNQLTLMSFFKKI